MSLPPEYLKYAHRGYGMDHGRYIWSALPGRKKVNWPGGARIALWIVPALEWFPLDMKGKPFKPPGALVTRIRTCGTIRSATTATASAFSA